MSTSTFVFPGYFAYLEAAAAQLGHPESARGSARQVALTALANLCAQASRADVAHVDAILKKATEFRDQLAIALQAADAMLADVEAARTAPDPPPASEPSGVDEPELETEPEPAVSQRDARKPPKGRSS